MGNVSKQESKKINTVGELCTALSVGGGDDEYFIAEDELFIAGAKMRGLLVQLKPLLLRDLHEDKRPTRSQVDTAAARLAQKAGKNPTPTSNPIDRALTSLLQGTSPDDDLNEWLVLGADTRVIVRETVAAMNEFKAQIRAALQGPGYRTIAEAQVVVGDRPLVVQRFKPSDFGLKD